MLDLIKGIVLRVGEQSITILPGSRGGHGIGLKLHVPNAHLFSEGAEVVVEVYMHWHSDQGPTLFGFSSQLEKTLFEIIIGCSGIGPRLALALLHELTSQDIVKAVSADDTAALSSVSGIGPRKAEQMLVSMRPKIQSLIESGADTADSMDAKRWKEVTEVLRSLNYSRPEISRAMNHLTKEHAGSNLSFDVLVRHALLFLAKRI